MVLFQRSCSKDLNLGFCCGSTSHSAIFQLYKDKTDVQFPNIDLLPDTYTKGSFTCPDTGTRKSRDIFDLLAIKMPTCSESTPGIKPGFLDL